MSPITYVRSDVTLNASASTAILPRRYGPAAPVNTEGLFLQCRQASSNASTNDRGLSHTALHELHVRKGGKMVPFGGYSMPVQYSDLSVGESHKWTREKSSLFDVGHM